MVAMHKEDAGGRVEPSQRFTRSDPCPVCQGFQSGKHGEHCYGYWSKDHTKAFCTEQECGGSLRQNHNGTFTHRLDGTCACGLEHGMADSAARPFVAPARPSKRVLHALIPHTLRDGWHETMRFPYHGAGGELVYYVVRYDPPASRRGEKKRPLPYQPVGDQWACDEQGLTRILYRLPDLLAAPATRTVFIPEGEKCVEALRALGLVATCNPGGAGKWHTILPGGSQDALRGRHVVILPDADDPGRTHAPEVASYLADVAASVRIVALPGLAEGEDIVDWIAAGGTKDALYELVIATPVTQATAQDDAAPERHDDGAPGALMAANVHMNQRLHIVQRTATAATLKPSARVALLAVRREIERNSHQLDTDGMVTIWKMDELAKDAGLSVATLRKEIDLLASGDILRKKHIPSTNGNRLVAVGIGPHIDTPWEASIPEKAPPHGGKRAGAGRPRVCPECGSTNIRVTKKTVLVIKCRKHGCGAVTEKILGEEEVTSPDGAWAEGTNIQDECQSPNEADEHLEAHESPYGDQTESKMNVTPPTPGEEQCDDTPPCPTHGATTYRNKSLGWVICRSCVSRIESVAS